MQYNTYDQKNPMRYANQMKETQNKKATLWQKGDRLFKEASPPSQEVILRSPQYEGATSPLQQS